MIRECLEEGKILLAPDASDYRRLIESMLAKSGIDDISMNGKSVSDLIMERDLRMPTALGKGIAVPRLISDQIDHNEIIIAINSAGLPVVASDQKPVKILFLLLLSTTTAYADVLAQSLRLLNDEALKDELLKARDPGEVCRIIQRWEQD